ncbi:hypothetical protein ACFIJ5_07395 [Haloimpatiens sp. FM7330]|uniref:DUF7662 domain-containing protein n=1 Tax=Haloimpatiens sp. FM7330 TaxID=3298610 RepID=UPI0036324EE2
MAKGDKFLQLTNYFKVCSEERISLTFDEIEQILGFSLSPSAYNYEAYWYLSKTHNLPVTWISQGYKLENLNLIGQEVSFIKSNIENISVYNIEKFNKKVEKVKVNMEYKISGKYAIENIKKYYNVISKDKNGRYKSWEHCFKYFNENKNKGGDENIVEVLCLHLAFYLASWGMYRGSSFLLQKDYKVHHEAVLEILKEKYKPLWNIKCSDLIDRENLELIFEAKKELKDIYINNRKNIDDHKEVSDILITKILMGTFGCVPAYDRFFVKGIKTYKVAGSIFNEKSIDNLAKFYIANYEQFEKCRQEISRNGVEYSQMKLLDMCFWQIGYDKSNE